MAAVHIRKPMRRRGGNQYRLDRAERAVATYCGAPVTDKDWDHRAALAKKNREALLEQVCGHCVMEIQLQGDARNA